MPSPTPSIIGSTMPHLDLRDLMCSTVIFVRESHGAGDKTVPVPQRDTTWYNITTIFHHVFFPTCLVLRCILHVQVLCLLLFYWTKRRVYICNIYVTKYQCALAIQYGNTMSCNVTLCRFSSLWAFVDGHPSVFVPHPPLQKMVIIFLK